LSGTSGIPQDNKVPQECGIATSVLEELKEPTSEQTNATKTEVLRLIPAKEHIPLSI